MTNAMSGGENITWTSLCNTLRKLWHKQDQDVLYHQMRRPELVGRIEQLRVKDKEYDPPSLAMAREVLYIWDKQIRWHAIFQDLCNKLESNSLPGERHRLLTVATILIPKVSKYEWKQIFQHYHVDYDVRVYFPVEVEAYDIDALETQLHELAHEDGYILVSTLSDMLCMDVRSKQYVQIKKKLSQRGWRWQRRRNSGALLNVIIPPFPLRENS